MVAVSIVGADRTPGAVTRLRGRQKTIRAEPQIV